MSPYAEYPKNPRSQEWGREAIEMHENGSTKNLLQMTDVYYSVGVCPAGHRPPAGHRAPSRPQGPSSWLPVEASKESSDINLSGSQCPDTQFITRVYYLA